MIEQDLTMILSLLIVKFYSHCGLNFHKDNEDSVDSFAPVSVISLTSER